MFEYERTTLRRFHHIIAVSEHDRELMAAMTDRSRITIAPTGVDVSEYSVVAGIDAPDPIVMFLGSMDWEANVDGVEYFCREMWPQVRAAVPNAVFRIVGRRPGSRVRRLAADSSVEITGDVASPVEYLRDAAVFVVPLRIGGGTRLKIYEAMAAGRAVVSTSVGAEGLDVDNDHMVLTDDPGEFAQAVSSLLLDAPRRKELERKAAVRAARFDWSSVVRQFEDSLEQTIEAWSHTRPADAVTAE
jgi:glycosyltransferase involved in cell wall biosynthesis